MTCFGELIVEAVSINLSTILLGFAADELGHRTAERRTLPSGIKWQNKSIDGCLHRAAERKTLPFEIKWQSKSIDDAAAALYDSYSFADAKFVGMQFVL